MLPFEFPENYITSVNRGSEFHKNNKTWSGKGTLQYFDILDSLIQKHQIKTVLDFGSGKGLQYTEYHIDKKLNIEVVCYDPCLHGLDNWPSSKYDMVIALDCVTNIDKDLIPWMYDWFSKWALKCVIVGTHLEYKGNFKKQDLIQKNKITKIEELIPTNIDLSKFYIVDHLNFVHPR